MINILSNIASKLRSLVVRTYILILVPKIE